jgi:hypothetical protein
MDSVLPADTEALWTPDGRIPEEPVRFFSAQRLCTQSRRLPLFGGMLPGLAGWFN